MSTPSMLQGLALVLGSVVIALAVDQAYQRGGETLALVVLTLIGMCLIVVGLMTLA